MKIRYLLVSLLLVAVIVTLVITYWIDADDGAPPPREKLTKTRDLPVKNTHPPSAGKASSYSEKPERPLQTTRSGNSHSLSGSDRERLDADRGKGKADETIAIHKGVPDEDGIITLTRIVKRAFKYPILRIQERINVSNPGGTEEILDRKTMVADHLMVRLNEGRSAADLESILDRIGARVRKVHSLSNLVLVAFDGTKPDNLENIRETLLENPDVVDAAEPDYIVAIDATIPNDPKFDQLPALNGLGSTNADGKFDIGITEAWDITTGSEHVKVAVLDTGIDYTHPDLAENIWVNPLEIPNNDMDDDGNGLIDDVHGYDFYNNHSNPMDDHGHGTHVSGTIGAVGNNGLGVVGVNWNVNLMVLKFLNEAGFGTTSDAIEALTYAYQMGADLTSNSWGGGDYSESLRNTIDKHRFANIPFIAAAGNDGVDTDLTPHYPASYPCSNIISIAASNNHGGLAPFSNFGRRSVDIVAPGMTILSTLPNGEYGTQSGTSMAAAHVSGVVALMKSAMPGANYLKLKAGLLVKANFFPSLEGKIISGGHVNAFRAFDNEDIPVMSSAVSSLLGLTEETIDDTFLYVDHWPTPRPIVRANATLPESGFNETSDNFEREFVNLNVEPEGDMPRNVVFTPDGQSILVVNRDSNNVSVYDINTRELTDSIAVGDYPVDIAVSADGKYAVVPNVFDDTVSVIDLATRTIAATVPVTGNQPFRVRITTDSQHAVVGIATGVDKSSRISVISLTELSEKNSFLTPRQGGIAHGFNSGTGVWFQDFSDFKLAQYNQQVVLLDYNIEDGSTMNVYDLVSGSLLNSFFVSSGARSFDISMDDTQAVVADPRENKITVINLVTNTVTKVINVPTVGYGPVRITPNKTHAIFYVGNSASFVDLTTEKITSTLTTRSFSEIEFTHDNRYAFIPSFISRVIHLKEQSIVADLELASSNEGAVSPVAHHAVALNNHFGENIHFYTTHGLNSQVLGAIPSGQSPEADAPSHVAVSSDGHMAVISHLISGNVAIVDLKSNTVRSYIDTSVGWIVSTEISPDGRHAVSVNIDADTIAIIDLLTETVVATVHGFAAPAHVRISPDGTMAYVISLSGTDRLHFVRLEGANSHISSSLVIGEGAALHNRQSMALSKDGSFLVLCVSRDDEVVLVNTNTQQEITRVKLPRGSLPTSVVLSRDGTTAYVGNEDGNSLSILQIDGDQSRILHSIENIPSPRNIVLDEAGNFSYVASYLSAIGQVSEWQIHVIDHSTNSIVKTIIFPYSESHGLTNLFLSVLDSILYVGSGKFSTSFPIGFRLKGELFRIAATGVSTSIMDRIPLTANPEHLAFSNSLKKAIVTEKDIDGVDIITFSDFEVGFRVTRIDPASGIELEKNPKEIRITVNEDIDRSTLDPADLTVNGTVANSVSVIDGRTAIFGVDSLNEGEYAIALAADSFASVSGKNIVGFESAFSLVFPVKELTASPVALDFGSTPITSSKKLWITLSNSGNRSTTVESVDIDNGHFHISTNFPIVISPLQSERFEIVFSPNAVATERGTLTLHSDATTNPSLEIPLTGIGIPAPRAEVSPDKIALSLLENRTATVSIELTNSGDSPLTYSLRPRLAEAEANQPASVNNTDLVVNTLSEQEMFAHDHVPGQLIVGLRREHAAVNVVHSMINQVGMKVERELARARRPGINSVLNNGQRLLLLDATDTTIDLQETRQALLKNPTVAFVEPNYIVKAVSIPADPNFNWLYGLHNTGQTGGTADADIDAPEAWDITVGSKDIRVGVIDTGIDYTHPDLAANIWTNPGEIPENGIDDDSNGYIDDVHGYDFYSGDGDPMDDHGHGTHVAGTIGAVANDIGVVGVAQNVQLAALKFLGPNGSGWTSDAVDAMAYANAMDIPITSNSWGGGGFSQALKNVIDAGGEKGYLFIAAAGNDDDDTDEFAHFPSSYSSPNIIAVASTDDNDQKSYFSNFGLESVDVAAPGSSIFSAYPDSSYRSFSGTSMATPHVSGIAVLVKAKNPLLSGKEIKDSILKSVDPIPSLDGLLVTGGRVNAHQALLEAPDPWFTISPANGSVAPGETEMIRVTVDTSNLKPDLHEAIIAITTNDPDHSSIHLPLFLDVASSALDLEIDIVAKDWKNDVNYTPSPQESTTFSGTAMVNGRFINDVHPGDRISLGINLVDPLLATVDMIDTISFFVGDSEADSSLSGTKLIFESAGSLDLDLLSYGITGNPKAGTLSGLWAKLQTESAKLGDDLHSLFVSFVVPEKFDKSHPILGNQQLALDQLRWEISLAGDHRSGIIPIQPATASVSFQTSEIVLEEGDSPLQIPIELTLTDGGPLEQDLILSVTDEGSGTATSGIDYVNFGPSQQLVFPAGARDGAALHAVLKILNDELVEDEEDVNLILKRVSGPATFTLGGITTFKARLRDTTEISIHDAMMWEHDTGDYFLEFTVSLNHPDPSVVSVDYQTRDGMATVADGDYEAASGTLVFNPNETIKTISIPIIGDLEIEDDETLFVKLTNPANAGLLDSEGMGTIRNDDAEENGGSNPNLFVSAKSSRFENTFSGAMVIEVVVADIDINDTDVEQLEPDVTVNGKPLRMVQAEDGNWYAYFAQIDMAMTADATVGLPGFGLDYGEFCHANSTIAGIDLSDTSGFAVPRDIDSGSNGLDALGLCDEELTDNNPLINNVVRDPRDMNTYPLVNPGQIGLNDNAWPLTQFYHFSPSENVIVKYYRDTDLQYILLSYDTAENFVEFELDREHYTPNAHVHVTVTDLALNIDPTDEDSWTFATHADSPMVVYQAFDKRGNLDADGTAGAVNLFDELENLGFAGNGFLLLDVDAQRMGMDAVNLFDNKNQQIISGSRAADAISAGGSFGPGTQPLTLTERNRDSGVFSSYDDDDDSNLRTTGNLGMETSATIQYNETQLTILNSASDALIKIELVDEEWNSGEEISVILTDPDANKNAYEDEDLDVWNPEIESIPSLTIGNPFTLERLVSAELDGKRLTIDDVQPISHRAMLKIGSSDAVLQTGSTLILTLRDTFTELFHSINDPSGLFSGFNFLNVDLRSFERTLERVDVAAVDIAVTDGQQTTRFVDRNLQDFFDLNEAIGDDIFRMNEHAEISIMFTFHVDGNPRIPKGTVFPMVCDFFSFGKVDDGTTSEDRISNMIVRLELEETGDNTDRFEGSLEYTMWNQLNILDQEIYKTLDPIDDDPTFIAPEGLVGERAPKVVYLDRGEGGVVTPISDQQDIPAHSAIISFDLEAYKVTDTVQVTLKDADLNTNSDLLELYTVVPPSTFPEDPAKDTVGIPGLGFYSNHSFGAVGRLLEITFNGERWSSGLTENGGACGKAGFFEDGLASTDFLLIETDSDSGIFIGDFQIPYAYCHASTGAIESTVDAEIGVHYIDYIDEDNHIVEVSDTASVSAGDPIEIRIHDAMVWERDIGESLLEFAVLLNHPYPFIISVDYTTRDGMATVADGDYKATRGSLVFNPGEISHTFSIPVNGDFDSEEDETLFVELSNPVNAELSDSQGIGTIRNDDFADDDKPNNANLYVSAENSKFENTFSGAMVTEVVVVNPDINDVDIEHTEPDVTVKGKTIRMVQAVDGNWYGYFAQTDMAMAADATAGLPGFGLDYGELCHADSTITGIDLSATAGFAVPRDIDSGSNGLEDLGLCNGTLTKDDPLINHVVRRTKEMNTDPSVSPGQIGLNENAWPFIQFYPFNPGENVVVKYYREEKVQDVTLIYKTSENFVELELDRKHYSPHAQVHVTLTDLALNIDPTDEDSWTFGTHADSPMVVYQAFGKRGNPDADGTAGAVNLFDELENLGFAGNGFLLLDVDAQRAGVDAVNLFDNKDQQIIPGSRAADAISAGGTFGPGTQPLTLTEFGPNSGVFESYDHDDHSNLKTTGNPGVEASAIIEYKDTQRTILISYTDANIDIQPIDKEWNSGEEIPVVLIDPDANKNTREDEDLDVWNPEIESIPTLAVGKPFTLENLKKAELGGNQLSIDDVQALSQRAMLRVTSKDIVIENANALVLTLSDRYADLFRSINDPSGAFSGFNFFNFDIRSFDKVLERRIDSVEISVTDGQHTARFIDRNFQDLINFNEAIGDDVFAMNPDANVQIIFTFNMEDDLLIPEGTILPIVCDFFSFGKRNDGTALKDRINNLILRLELEETGDNTSTFAGSLEFTMLNNLNILDPNIYEDLSTIADDPTFVVPEGLIGEHALKVVYLDRGGDGVFVPISDPQDIPAHSAIVSFDLEFYKVGDTVYVTVEDQDLNTDSGHLDIYRTVSPLEYPDDPARDTVGVPGLGLFSDNSLKAVGRLLEITFNGERWSSGLEENGGACGQAGFPDDGLAAADFYLIETGRNSGVFVGSFAIPETYCNAATGTIESTVGAEIGVHYLDYVNKDNHIVEVSDVANAVSFSGSVSLDRTVYPIPFGAVHDFFPEQEESDHDTPNGDSLFPIHHTGVITDGDRNIDAAKEEIGPGDLKVHIRVDDPDFDTSAYGEDRIARGDHGPVKIMIQREDDTLLLATAGGEAANEGLITIGPDIVSGVTRELGPMEEIAANAGIFEVELPIRYTDGPETVHGPITPDAGYSSLSGETGALGRFNQEPVEGSYALLAGDVLIVEYTDPRDKTGRPKTMRNSATFGLHNAMLLTFHSEFLIGSDVILTLLEPDLNLNANETETYTLDLLEWNSAAARLTMGEVGGEITAFDPEPLTLRELGDNTGFFQTVVTIPQTLKGNQLEQGEEIQLQYMDWAPAESDYVGQRSNGVHHLLFPSNVEATVELDQNDYSWTDKVVITVIAPDWNIDPNKIDSIGGTGLNPVRIATRNFTLDHYQLVETGTDTGVFTGEVILTGFLHDADGNASTGDGNGYDTNPRTEPVVGGGPFHGFIETKDDDDLTVAFEYFPGKTAVTSAPIRWNIGEVQWLEASYPADGTGVVRVVDADMNLDPESVDVFGIEVWSETDQAGIQLTVTETKEASGIFEGMVSFSTSDFSSGQRLRITPGDTLSASYFDHTFPDSFGTANDPLTIDTASIEESASPPPPQSTVIRFDQETYSWTDQVGMLITSADHNLDPDQIETIGSSDANRIRIATRGHALDYYSLVETGPDTGVFAGHVTLTGFLHDADGDWTTGDPDGFDTIPHTGPAIAGGPDNGFLEARNTDGMSVSMQISKTESVVKSAPISWNIGVVEWLNPDVSFRESAVARIIDADMNLNPDLNDQFLIDVWSDTDFGGIDLVVVETDIASGIFEGKVRLATTGESMGNQLRVADGDRIDAEYEDNTLPLPHLPRDERDIISTFQYRISPIGQVQATNARVINAFGNTHDRIQVGQKVQIMADLTSSQDKVQPYTYLVQIKNEDGIVAELAWTTGELDPRQDLSAAITWTPKTPGLFEATVFLWEFMENQLPLADIQTLMITVNTSDSNLNDNVNQDRLTAISNTITEINSISQVPAFREMTNAPPRDLVISSNNSSYCQEDLITLNGKLSGEFDPKLPFTLRVMSLGGEVIHIDQTPVEADGSYKIEISASPPKWATEGIYMASLSHETIFSEVMFGFQVSDCHQTPVPLIHPKDLIFANVPIGTTVSQNVVVSNIGFSDLHVNSMVITGPDASQFTSETLPFTLGSGENRIFNIFFTPDRMGAFFASLAFRSNAGKLNISLTGTGVCVVNQSSISIPFHSSFDSECAETYSCYIPSKIAIAAGNRVVWHNDDLAYHTVTSGSPETGADGRFDSGSFFYNETFSHTFTQPGHFPYYCTLHPWMKGIIRISQKECDSTSLAISPSTIDFGDIVLGKSGFQSIIISNSGQGMLTIDPISIVGVHANHFDVDNENFALDPGESKELIVGFSPEKAMGFNAALVVESSGGAVAVPLSGSGIDRGQPSDRFVGHWKLDELGWTGSDREVMDHSNFENHGTTVGGARTVETGQIGRAGEFDGINDVVRVPDHESLRMDAALTVSVWVKPNAQNGTGIILNKEGEYEIAIFSDHTLRFALANRIPGWKWINTEFIVPQNKWSHIAWTYDPDGSVGNQLRVYVNGNEIFTCAGTGAIGDTRTDANELRIGGRQATPQYFHGLIDDVRLFNRGLSAIEVMTIYDETSGISRVQSFSLTKPFYTNDEYFSFTGIESEGSHSVFVIIRNRYLEYVSIVSDPNSERDGHFETILGSVSDFFESPGIYEATAFTDEQKDGDGISIELHYDGNRVTVMNNVSLKFDKHHYDHGESAILSFTGSPLETVEVLIIDSSDKPIGSAIPIEIASDGQATHTLLFDDFDTGVYTAVANQRTYRRSVVFTVGFSTHSETIEIFTSEKEYEPGKSLSIFGTADSYVILTLSLSDPRGNLVDFKETFSDKNGKITDDSFYIPINAEPGIWSVTARSGSSFARTEFEVISVRNDPQTPAFLFEFGTLGIGNDEFDSPTDLAISNVGETLYVADSENNRIKIFELLNGDNCSSGNDDIVDDEVCFDVDFGSFGSAVGQFDIPTNLVIDKDTGDIYVVDSNNNRVQRFQSDGNFDNLEFGSADYTGDDFLGNPSAIAKHKKSDYIYVADSRTDSISVFDDDGHFKFRFGDTGSDNNEFRNPSAMIIDDRNNRLYVADTDNNRIQIFELTDGDNCPGGTDEIINDEVCFVHEFGSSGSGDGNFDEPSGLAFDEDKNLLYVADTENDRIQVFEIVSGNTCPSGTDEIIDGICFLDEFGSSGSSQGQFYSPSGLVVNPFQKRLYIADTGNHRIQVFTLASAANPVPDPPTQLSATAISPTSIALTWEAPRLNENVSKITGYKIEFKVDSGEYSVLMEDPQCTVTSFVHKGLDVDSTYTYRVSAINAAGFSNPSSSVTAKPRETQKPVGLIATAISPSQIVLTWHPPSETYRQAIEGYRVEREILGEFLYETIAEIDPSTTYVVNGLVTDEIYSYAVRARFPVGYSPRSNSGVATPRANSTILDFTCNLSVFPNQVRYRYGDTITFSGQIIDGLVPTLPVILEIFSGNNLIHVAQVMPNDGGRYSYNVTAEGDLWPLGGDYTTKVKYGIGLIAQTTFKLEFNSSTLASEPLIDFNILSRTVYEDAEDETIDGWLVYGDGNVVNRVEESGNRIISTEAKRIDDPFRLGLDDNSDWNNHEEFTAYFAIRMEEKAAVYFRVDTSDGEKYLCYRPGSLSIDISDDVICFSLDIAADGQWHTITRNLAKDLEQAIPDSTLISVKDFYVFGSVKLDDLMLLRFNATD